jgi:hypothetical protein
MVACLLILRGPLPRGSAGGRGGVHPDTAYNTPGARPDGTLWVHHRR